MRRDLGFVFQEPDDVKDVQPGAVALVYPASGDDTPLLLQRGLDNHTTIGVMQHADALPYRLAAGETPPGISYDTLRGRSSYVVVRRD